MDTIQPIIHRIQYMALLRYTNPAYLPCLYEVRISYDTLTGIYTHKEQLPQTPMRISPNPFTTQTSISYVINEPNSTVCIRVFDITGRCVKTLVNSRHEPGTYAIEWSANNSRNQPLPEGVYCLMMELDKNNKDVAIFKVIYINE